MSSLRPESHVAQQIRRDKLRVQNNSSLYSQEFLNNNLEQQLPSSHTHNLDLLQVRDVRNANMLYNEPSLYSSSEVPNFQTALLNPLSGPRNTLEYHQQEQLGAAAEPCRLMMHQYGNSELRSFGNWRIGSGSNQGCDWFVNYASSSMANNESNNPNTALLASQLNNVPYNQHYMKPSYNEQLTAAQSSLNREIQKQLGGMHNHHHHNSSSSSASPLYQNALQDIVKSASIRAQGSENMASLMQQTGHGIWVGDAGELDLHPSYVNQPNHIHTGSGNPWTNRTVDNALRWISPLGFTDKKVDEHPQSLCLSLSSNAQSKTSVSQFEEGPASDDLQSGSGVSNKGPQYMKYAKSFMKPQDTMVSPSSSSYKNVGPLGPFTGYATILKSSRFLKSAQQLLDEFCCLSSPKSSKGCDVSERVYGEASASTAADAVTVNEAEAAAATKGGSNSGSSSSMFYGANESNADWGTGSGSCLSPRPDCQQKKARLLFMQEEVTRRYKQYHQQMQMVVSSFESVAGLSSSTPYISLALKSVSRHFRCLKNSISDQLKHISEALGEDFSFPSTSTCSDVHANMGRLRCMDQSIQKNKPGKGCTGLVEPPQHAWRAQRGLPERAVAILKAWLFEHFLHPYPTDTDKHMLATQTGLSRNQVSNWFINARVRVWKPMVEEIHMLETKGTTTSGNQNTRENEGTCGTEDGTTSQHPGVDKSLNKFGMMHSIPENQSHQYMEMDYSSSVACNADEENGFNAAEQWSQEKRSKLECQQQMNTSIDNGSLMGFVPYRRGSGLEVGGLGSVSLTLGLRHGVEGVQNQQQLQEEQLRRHFGGHMIHDFVG